MGPFQLFFCCSLLLSAFCSFVAEGRLGCQGEFGSCWNPEIAPPENGRKLYGAWKEEFNQGYRPPPAVGLAVDVVWSELRWVPSGPDPLHHNGSPKKPQTP